MKDKPDPFGTPIQTGSDWYLLLVGPVLFAYLAVIMVTILRMAVRFLGELV